MVRKAVSIFPEHIEFDRQAVENNADVSDNRIGAHIDLMMTVDNRAAAE